MNLLCDKLEVPPEVLMNPDLYPTDEELHAAILPPPIADQVAVSGDAGSGP